MTTAKVLSVKERICPKLEFSRRHSNHFHIVRSNFSYLIIFNLIKTNNPKVVSITDIGVLFHATPITAKLIDSS